MLHLSTSCALITLTHIQWIGISIDYSDPHPVDGTVHLYPSLIIHIQGMGQFINFSDPHSVDKGSPLIILIHIQQMGKSTSDPHSMDKGSPLIILIHIQQMGKSTDHSD